MEVIDRSVTVMRAIEMLQVSRRTVYNMLEDGRLARHATKPERISVASIERLLATTTIERATEMLQVSRRTVYNMLEDGRLVRDPNNPKRISVASIKMLLATRPPTRLPKQEPNPSLIDRNTTP